MSVKKGARLATRKVATASKEKGRPAETKVVQVQRTVSASNPGLRRTGNRAGRPKGKPANNPAHTRTSKRSEAKATVPETWGDALGTDTGAGSHFIDLEERQAHVWTKSEKIFGAAIAVTFILLLVGFIAGKVS